MAMAEQKNCDPEETRSHVLSGNGTREPSDRFSESAKAPQELWFTSADGIVVTKTRMIFNRHIDRNSFRSLPRSENGAGKARSRRGERPLSFHRSDSR